MEFPTINYSAVLAKLRNGIKPYQLPPDELRAYLDAEIASARVAPWETGEDDEELVEPSVPAPAPPRQRRRSLASTLKAARKAGADRVIVDGVVIALAPTAAVPAESNGNEFDEWMAKHAH